VLLLLEANRAVSTDRLIDVLWGEQAPRTAGAALRNTIARLRKQLGAEVIERSAPGYRLCTPEDSIDLVRFEKRVAAARSASEPERMQLLRDALTEWGGPPVLDLRYEPSLEGEIRRLEELRISVREDLFDAELEGGAAAELVPELEALIG